MTTTVATKLTQKMIEEIDKLVEGGTYTSRSEALRDAARLLLGMQRGAFKESGKTGPITRKEKEEALKSLTKRKGLKL